MESPRFKSLYALYDSAVQTAARFEHRPIAGKI